MPLIGRQHGATSVRLLTSLLSVLISNQPYPAIRVQVAVMVAWPACTLCIVRRLYYIASPTAVTTTQTEVRCCTIFGVAKGQLNGQSSEQKRREMIVDLLITIGIPVLQMILRKRYSPFPMSSI